MTLRVRLMTTALVLCGALLLAGCPPRVTIGQINARPGRYAGKEVTVAGRVTDSFGLLGTGIFELEDESGRIWVYSQGRGVPGNGARVAVTGDIEQGVSLGGRNFATILKETRRQH